MKIISILNHKGGVGKTTFTGSTAQALSLMGFRVLVIDNDSQHNLSTMLGVGVKSPNIRDVYLADEHSSPTCLLQSVKKTTLDNLHIITSCKDLRDSDILQENHLKRCMEKCRLERFYDFILIDNAPGIDRLQASAIKASEEIFVPTELKQFAVDGLFEMDQTIKSRYPESKGISRIIPNFYRNTIRQNSYISALNRIFPGKVTATTIPVDQVFDELITDNKILFIHRLFSKGAAYYLKLVHELFDLDEETIWDQVKNKRDQNIKNEARQRLIIRKEIGAKNEC